MSFILDGGQYEWLLENDGNTYGAAHICEGRVEDKLYEKLSVGNVIARQLDITLWNAPIDPLKPLSLSLKKTLGADESVVSKGVYFTDAYSKSPYSEYAEIKAYDALLKTDAPFKTSGSWNNPSEVTVARQIASKIGVSLNQLTDIYLSDNGSSMTEAPKIGDNGTTMREMLSVIGILHGGNWIIDDNNNLQLVLLNGNLYTESALTISDTDGLFYLKKVYEIEPGDYFVAVNDQGGFESLDALEATNDDIIVYVDQLGNFGVDTLYNVLRIKPEPLTDHIGDEVSEFDVSDAQTIEGVEVWLGNDVSFRAWDTAAYASFDDIEGAILSVSMPIMASQTVANNLWAQYGGFEFIPYKASNAYAAPEDALGTLLEIKDKTVTLSARVLNIDLLAACLLSSEWDAKTWYPYLSPVERSLQKQIDSTKTEVSAAALEQQVIYKSMPAGSGAPAAVTTWVTEGGNVQNTWTVTRPTYSSSYPVLYIAYQRQTMEQKGTLTCFCTPPVQDETTTVIDGGHITVGKIDAGMIRAGILADDLETPKNYWDLRTGEFVTTQGEIGGFTIDDEGIKGTSGGYTSSITPQGTVYEIGASQYEDAQFYASVGINGIQIATNGANPRNILDIKAGQTAGQGVPLTDIATIQNTSGVNQIKLNHTPSTGDEWITVDTEHLNVERHIYTGYAVSSSQSKTFEVGNHSTTWSGIVMGSVANVGPVIIGLTCNNGLLTAKNIMTGTTWNNAALAFSVNGGYYLTVSSNQPDYSLISLYFG